MLKFVNKPLITGYFRVTEVFSQLALNFTHLLKHCIIYYIFHHFSSLYNEVKNYCSRSRTHETAAKYSLLTVSSSNKMVCR